MSCGCGNQGSGGHNTTHPAPGPVIPKYEEMQALTAILNPDTLDREGVERKIMLFQSLPNGTLGYDQLEFDDVKLKAQKIGEVAGYYEKPSKLVPTLKYRSSIVSMVYDDVVSNFPSLRALSRKLRSC